MHDADQLDGLQTALAERYQIKRQLGSGGMATVYLAEDLKHHRELAIKVLKPELAVMLGPERFLREIEIAAQLNHPHILALIDSGEAGPFLYYVMPYVEGDSLRGRLNREKQLPIEEALRITEQVAVALDYAHRQGIVHRDIKPENILLHEGQALVADFGIALALHSAGGTRLTQIGFGLGTPEYMSPEQATAEREVDARSDIYSLACVLYELLVGEPPYTGPTAQAVLVKCLSDSVPSARRFRQNISASIDSALKRALARTPTDRFATATEFTTALRTNDLSPAGRTPYATNLPIQATPLVGRQRELAEAGVLLRSHRLVTLTGPGGSGKTRLALQLAAEAVEQFPDGIFWVPLQALRDSALVERAIGASVGADDRLIQHVATKQLLVVLDNFEQVIDAAATVATLLASTPNAKLLVTSREPLHVESEQRYQVEPLPDDDAATLFIERAREVAPGFRPTAAVGEICRRLDGLPLAIELAAARVALLDPDELLARLDRRLPLLASRSRNAPARQRTLRATIEWSYELLISDEQELFRRLAVFRGTFSLDAAEAVCGCDLGVLESLVEKSLVRRWGSGRLGMLDTIREYAVALLDAAPDADEVYRRHAEHFLSVAEEANLNAGTLRPGGQRLDIALAEQDNFRGALAWAVRSESIALGLDIATALEQLWVADDPNEGIRWFERLFNRPEAEFVSPSLRAQALRAYGSSLHIAGRHAAAEEMWAQSLAVFEQLEDEHGRAVLLHRLGISAMWRGELERAREMVEVSNEIHYRTGDVWGRAQTTGTLGAIARDEGDERGALDLVRESAALAREAGVPWWESGALAELACLSLNAGLVEEGEARARESLTIADQLRDRPGRIFGVGILARVAAEHGERERAARLWRAIEHEEAGAPLGGWRRHRKTCEERIRAAAGSELERSYTEGRALTLDDAVLLALEAADVSARRELT